VIWPEDQQAPIFQTVSPQSFAGGSHCVEQKGLQNLTAYCAVFVTDPSGWWTGRLRGKQGLFPNNYVTKI